MARKKPKASLKREVRNLETNKKILIVCEGEKTEPQYFNYLINKYRLNTASVVVTGDCGSSPKSVYEEALSLYEASGGKHQIEYDKVFCVYDCDDFTEHKMLKNEIKGRKAFELIFSNPCFEVWYIFHFNNSTKPFAQKGKKTASQQAKSEAKKLLDRHGNNLFQTLYERIDVAISNAHSNAKQNIENPYTNMYKLVEELIELKK